MSSPVRGLLICYLCQPTWLTSMLSLSIWLLICSTCLVLQKRSQTAWEKRDLTHAEHGLLPGNSSAPKAYPSWEHRYCLRAEGCQEGLEQSSEELIKRKQVAVSSHLLKKVIDSLLQWAASDLLCRDESPSSSIIPQQSKITSVRQTHLVALIRMD